MRTEGGCSGIQLSKYTNPDEGQGAFLSVCIALAMLTSKPSWAGERAAQWKMKLNPSGIRASVIYSKSFTCMEMILCCLTYSKHPTPKLSQGKGGVEREIQIVWTCQPGDQTSVDKPTQDCKEVFCYCVDIPFIYTYTLCVSQTFSSETVGLLFKFSKSTAECKLFLFR